ncbi:LAFE_0H05138g1_1 [Lachancea fermentati]|uniref:LAFE_0H05138g1_1 n=1 Tax=Lachancea fermentati TaxID=4955 RepID=A0A1G4MJT0_LACFM|nr:LAFE_0H05138g1_1 [Lachancea fermentati]
MPPRHPGLEREKRNAPAGTQARPLTSARRTCAPARALGHVQRRPIKLCESSTSGNRRRRSANKVAPIAIPTALPAALLARSQLRSQRAPSALPIAYPPCGPGHLRRQHSNEIHVLTAAADLRPGLRSCNHVRLRPALPSARRSAPVRSAFASAFASTFTSASFAPFEMLAAHLRHVSSLFFPTTTLGDSPRRKPPAPAPPRGRGSYTATPRPAPAAGSAVPAARALHDYAPETGNRHFERPPMRVCVTSRRALPRWAQAAGERPGDSRGWFMGVTVTATRAVIVAVTASTRRIVCGSRKKNTPNLRRRVRRRASRSASHPGCYQRPFWDATMQQAATAVRYICSRVTRAGQRGAQSASGIGFCVPRRAHTPDAGAQARRRTGAGYMPVSRGSRSAAGLT